MQKTGIVVPCYNEALRLDSKSFLNALEKAPELSFLFVDDGSTDGTFTVLEAIRRENPEQVDILALGHNRGKAEAVRLGMLKVIESQCMNVGYWDADLATPIEVISSFCNVLDSGDTSLVMGSRVKLLGRHIERNPLRHYIGRIFATCASLLLNIGVYDTQCGAKIFKNSALLKKVFGVPFKVNWTFDVELLARFSLLQGTTPSQASAKWHEYPLEKWVDVKGSKVKLKDYLVGAFEFCTLFTCLYTPARKQYEKNLLKSD